MFRDHQASDDLNLRASGTAPTRATRYQQEAGKFRQMAAAERSKGLRSGLLGLADRYEALALSFKSGAWIA